MLVLGISGDRVTMVSQCAVDVRVEMADTASIFTELSPQSSAVMKFETVRSGLFIRYGVAARLEMAIEVVLGYTDQLHPHRRWQVSGIENVDFHHWWVGRLYALDGLDSSIRVMSEMGRVGYWLANRLTTWEFHVKIRAVHV